MATQAVPGQQQGGSWWLGQAGSWGDEALLRGLLEGVQQLGERGFDTWVMPPLLLPPQGLQKDRAGGSQVSSGLWGGQKGKLPW